MAKTDTIRLDSLKLNDKNPRRIGEKEFQKLCASVKDFPKMMALRGIVVDKDNVVIGGNQRYRACQALGLTEIPAAWVKRAEDLTAKERRRFILADNAPDGAGGSWDMDMLANEWEFPELEEAGFDPDVLGDDSDSEEQEKTETLSPISRAYVLVSMTADQAMGLLPRIVDLAKANGAEVYHAAN